MERKAARQYFTRVKRVLVCSRADKRRILDRFESLLNTFQQENPEADYPDLVAAFGEPAACAAELLSGLGEAKFEAIRKRRLWVRRGIYAAVLAALVFLSAFLYYKYERSKDLNENAVVVVGPAVPMTREEAEAFAQQALEEARSQEEPRG